jgi:hypothetical protein
MRISAKTSYERYSKTKLPFLTYGEDGTIMNGHCVTETKEFLGHSYGKEKVRLKDYLVYRPIPKAILALRDKPDVHPDYEMQLYYTKLMKVMKEGIYIGETILCFVLGDHVYEILCTMTTVTQWKVLKQGVHCILLLIDIFLICFGKGIS